MIDKDSFKEVKEKVLISLWNFLDTYVDENYRLDRIWGKRSKIFDFYCSGKGVEIGASCYPIKINSNKVKISYVDYIDRNVTTDIKTQRNLPYVHVDIIDEAEKLDKIAKNSLDFVVHCHVLEHCRNPIGVIRTHLSKIKRKGILFIAIPNKNYIFDKERPLTEWEHFVSDDEITRIENDREHFREYLQLAIRYEGNTEEEIDRLIKDDYRPHFHVWNFETFYDFLLKTNDRLNNAFVIEHYSENRLNRKTRGETREIIAVLRKR